MLQENITIYNQRAKRKENVKHVSVGNICGKRSIESAEESQVGVSTSLHASNFGRAHIFLSLNLRQDALPGLNFNSG